MSEEIRVFGFASENDQTVFEGPVTINGLEYRLSSSPEIIQTAKGNNYHKVDFHPTPKPENPNQDYPALEGKLFRSQNIGVLDKVGFSIYTTIADKQDLKISGIFRDKKRDGTPYKSPLYILAFLPPRPAPDAAAAPQIAEFAGSEEIPF